MSVISLKGQWFPRYRLMFKIAIFGMKLGHWSKFQKLHIYSLSTGNPRVRNSELTFALSGPRFSRYWHTALMSCTNVLGKEETCSSEVPGKFLRSVCPLQKQIAQSAEPALESIGCNGLLAQRQDFHIKLPPHPFSTLFYSASFSAYGLAAVSWLSLQHDSCSV